MTGEGDKCLHLLDTATFLAVQTPPHANNHRHLNLDCTYFSVVSLHSEPGMVKNFLIWGKDKIHPVLNEAPWLDGTLGVGVKLHAFLNYAEVEWSFPRPYLFTHVEKALVSIAAPELSGCFWEMKYPCSCRSRPQGL